MSKNLSAKYYRENREKLQKKARENIKIFPKEEKESDNMVVNVTKISQKMKKLNGLSIEKDIIK